MMQMSCNWLRNDVVDKMINIDSIQSLNIEEASRYKEDKYNLVVQYKDSESPTDIIFIGTHKECSDEREKLWDRFVLDKRMIAESTQALVDMSGLLWRLINILHPDEMQEEDMTDGEEEQSQPA